MPSPEKFRETLAEFVVEEAIVRKNNAGYENVVSKTNKKIKTERLNIYPASDEAMERLIASQTVPELKEAYRQMLDGCLRHPDQRQWYAVWNIELNDEGRAVVGNLSFKGLEADGILEIGYGTNPGYEGQGLMTEAVMAVVRWAAAQEGVKQIEAETEENNAASKRVLEKAGFVPNGKTGDEGPRFVWKG